MAEGEGVIEATGTEFKRHPYLIVGGLVAVVAVLWLVSRSGSSSTTGQNFTFSYGPSDAQISAGTAQQIATQQAQTAVSLATTQASTQTAIAQDYFGYLATNSANQLAATVNSNQNTATIAQTAAGAQITMNAADNYTQQIQSNNALTGLLSTNATTQADDLNGNATQLAITQANNQTTIDTASLAAGSSNTQNATSFVSSLYASLLGRTPDASGLAFWTNAINTGALTDAQVYGDIANSAERQSDITQGHAVST